MKPTKQTIYLPVNGEPEINTVIYETGEYIEGVLQCERFVFTPEQLNAYTANVIKQALETAAEKATMRLLVDEENDIIEEANIDKQSITNTFDETFKKFEV